MEYEEDDVILCKVKKIEGTSVFLETEEGFPGSMILSEVAAGRIRNLRAYVSPNRIVACKILRVKKEHLELSLRRVTAKEKREVLERHKKERAFASMLKIVGEKENLLEKIKEEHEIGEFFDEAREDIAVLEKFLSKDKAKRIYEMLKEKDEKEKKVGMKFVLRSDSERGVEDIKDILNVRDAEIHYLGSGKFSISVSAKDFKDANVKMENVLKEIENRAGRARAAFEIWKGK